MQYANRAMGEPVANRALAMPPGSSADEAIEAVRRWIDANVPLPWREAAARGGRSAIRAIRTREAYEQWYPVFGASGLVAPTWPVAYGGLDLEPSAARVVEAELQLFNLGRLNPLGLNLAAPALFAHGTEEQRLRYLPPIVRNEEMWCQLFSEPGAGSDLASLATRAERDGDTWVVSGQKVWTTWAHLADRAVLLARTDPGAPKRKGITYFLLDLHSPGVEVRPLRHMGGEADFNEVFLTEVRIPDDCRVGEVGAGWVVASATLSGERQMVSGSGSGGVDRIGGSGAGHLLELARVADRDGRWSADAPVARQAIVRVYGEEQIRSWTNQRVRATLRAGRSPGPETSVGKVHQGDLNQRMQELAADLLGIASTAWEARADADWAATLPREVKGMLRSRANTIEGGTSEVNKNIVAERVLGLPRDVDPYRDAPWREVPRS
ncbi:MAG TPA: acyl-CoA dehydrogenase family protein [Acidimicrobiales bacterium]|jgi:alkylation response protein AidB-like acyl-CoA dehydrogenase|nr:acyl-CoA dehydrogenase family protein [Acidimicrobiales bacterium]